MSQRCDEKITMSLDDSIEDVLAQLPAVKSVKLGYVGHWSSSEETKEFIEEKLLPSIKKYKVFFDIHNSACLSMEQPYTIRSYLKGLGSNARYIHMYGYQAISTGGWDPVLPGKHNFWSAVNGNSLEVQFPNCKEFELNECWGRFQKNGKGICFDEKNNKYVRLACVKNTRKVTRQNPDGRGSRKVNQTRFEWINVKPQFYYEAKPDRVIREIVLGNTKNSSEGRYQHIFDINEGEDIPESEIHYAKLKFKRSELISGLETLNDEEFEREYDKIMNMSDNELMEKSKDIGVVVIQDNLVTIPGIRGVYAKDTFNVYSDAWPISSGRSQKEAEDYIQRLNQDFRYILRDFTK